MQVADLTPADQVENEVFAADFTARLVTGETLSTTSWFISMVVGEDAAASSRLVGSPSISGNKSLQRVSGLLKGRTYRLQATVTTSMGNTLSIWSHVVCKI